MKKSFLIFGLLVIWASAVSAEQAVQARSGESPADELEAFQGRIGFGWYDSKLEGNTIAGEYAYEKSGPAGVLDLDWTPLPHRLAVESYYFNRKDYFGELDYAFKDIVVINGFTRDMFHNLHHYGFGSDDPLTATPIFTDLNPGELYGIDNHLSRGFLRLKTPDFPFHIYGDIRTINRSGTIQQRFLQGDPGLLNKASQSRDIDWNTREYRVGVNSHLGPVEADYHHAEKKFEALGEKVLYDTTSGTAIPHNLVPDLKSSSDTVKIHTTYSGKIVLSGTYTTGDKENQDSGAKIDFKNMAGDFMFMPVTSVIFTLKYRHYDLDALNPDTINAVTVSGIQALNVRDSISSTRDVVSGVLRYRATDRLTFKGEYITDSTDRTRGVLGDTLTISTVPAVTGPAYWLVPQSTTKNTGKLGFTYRVMKKSTFRADYSLMSVDNPAYSTDPDKANSARASWSWMPTHWFNSMLSYGAIRETREELNATLGGGSRDAARDRALASVTLIVGERSSLTASYAYHKNNVEQTISLQDGTGALVLEPNVPYDDTSHVGSVSLTVAPTEGLNITGSASRSYSRGNFRLAGAGSVTNVSGIAELSDLKIIDTVYGADVEIQHARNMSSEVRFQYRHYDDEIDDTQDGRANIVLAILSLKW